MQATLALLCSAFALANAANSLSCYEGYSFYNERPDTKATNCFTCQKSVMEYKGSNGMTSKLIVWEGLQCDSHPNLDWDLGETAYYVKTRIQGENCMKYDSRRLPDTTTTTSTTTTSTTSTTSTTTTSTTPPTKCAKGYEWTDTCAYVTDAGYRAVCTCCSDDCNDMSCGPSETRDMTSTSASPLMNNLTCHAGWSFDGSTPTGEMTMCSQCVKYVKKVEVSGEKRALYTFKGIGCTGSSSMPSKDWFIYDPVDIETESRSYCLDFYVPNNMATTTSTTSTTTTTTTSTTTTSWTTPAPQCGSTTTHLSCTTTSGMAYSGAAAGCVCCTNKCNTKALTCEPVVSTDPKSSGDKDGGSGSGGNAASSTQAALATLLLSTVFASASFY